jgi:hypothetical protein
MASIAFGDRSKLEDRFTPQRVVQLFDFDGDGLVAGTDETRLEAIINDANDVVTGILLGKGFTLAQLALLVTDSQIVRAWAGICAQLAGEAKTEWLDDEGKGPFDGLGQRSRAELKAMSRGEIRSRLELESGGAGINSTLRGEKSTATPTFIFNRDPNNPNDRNGPGGF